MSRSFWVCRDPKGKQAARLRLNNREIIAAASRSRAELKELLEKILKRLQAHTFIPYTMENSGQDVRHMTDEAAQSLVRGRECGECQVCCIALTIDKPEIQKMPGSACRHSLGGGCASTKIARTSAGCFFAAGGSWRDSRRLAPDQSGILVIGESNELPQFQPVALNLFSHRQSAKDRPAA